MNDSLHRYANDAAVGFATGTAVSDGGNHTTFWVVLASIAAPIIKEFAINFLGRLSNKIIKNK